MRLLLDLRWVRSEILDGIGRVSLSVTAELLLLHPDWPFGLLFADAKMRDFALEWIRAYHYPDEIVADYQAMVTGFGPQSPLNRALLWKQVKAFRPDVYYSFYYIFHPLPVTQVCTVHDLIPLIYPQYFQQASLGFRMAMTRAQTLRWLLKPMDGIVTVSNNTCQDLVEKLGIAAERIHVCPPGVEQQRSEQPLHGDLAGLASGYILSVGRPDPHKNFHGLIEAYSDLSPELRRDHPLVLAGPGDKPYTRKLEQQIKALKLDRAVYLLGAIDSKELPALYKHAAAFALVSYYEGFGLPVLEAMAQGTPVLTSDCSSLPEVAGDAALLVNPDRPMEIAWALNRILKVQSVADALRRRGLKRVARFSWERTAERLSAALREIKDGVAVK
ncbi:MAG TPA: glycosyltransferase family 1 protein [Candidatus Obscuribacterales bacterium]